MAIQRESLVNIAIKRMKKHIAEGGWQPGDKYLSERELTNRLQVSRTVIREALISLQSVGMVNIKSGGGVYIADSNVAPIKEILKHYDELHGVKVRELAEIRKVIELGGLRLIIEKDVAIDIAHLQSLNEAYHQAIKDHDDTRQADKWFHQFLIKSTMNETFYHFSEIIHEYFTLTKIDVLQSETTLMKAYNEHNNIIHALENKNMKKAQEIMIDHLEPILTFTKQMEEVELDGTDSNR